MGNESQNAGKEAESQAEEPMDSYAYVDGSYSKENNAYGYGGYLIDQFGSRHDLIGSGNDPKMLSMGSVAGELEGALAASRLARKLEMKSLLIYYNYSGIENWFTGEWQTKKEGPKAYHDEMHDIAKSVAITFRHVDVQVDKKDKRLVDTIARRSAEGHYSLVPLYFAPCFRATITTRSNEYDPQTYFTCRENLLALKSINIVPKNVCPTEDGHIQISADGVILSKDTLADPDEIGTAISEIFDADVDVKLLTLDASGGEDTIAAHDILYHFRQGIKVDAVDFDPVQYASINEKKDSRGTAEEHAEEPCEDVPIPYLVDRDSSEEEFPSGFTAPRPIDVISPYFSAEVLLNAPLAAPEVYATVCENLANYEGITVIPTNMEQLGDGTMKLSLIGKKNSNYKGNGSERDISLQIASFFSGQTRIKTYELGASAEKDVLEEQHIERQLALSSNVSPCDFDPATYDQAMQGLGFPPAADSQPSKCPSGTDELNALIGLEDIKKQLIEIVSFVAARMKNGKEIPSINIMMLGNPGTGKTTVARIFGHMLADRGIISGRDVFIEGDRETLVGRWQGHTAEKTKKAVERARHGVLFIDEAYALIEGEHDDFGHEALDTLVKAMEDCYSDFRRLGFVTILAGYQEPMKNLMASNPGLESRIGFTLNFPDYTAAELMEIFNQHLAHDEYTIDEDAASLMLQTFEELEKNKKDSFGNGRLVRQIFNRLTMRQATLYADDSCIHREAVESVLDDEIMKDLLKNPSAKRIIGFA